MKKVFIETREHFLIAADTITKIEVVKATEDKYALRVYTTEGLSYWLGRFDDEEVAWKSALAFLEGFAEVVSFD